MMDTRLQPDLETIRSLRVYFGHQSVGGNILEGVAALSRQAGMPVSFTNINSPGRPVAFFAESLIGRNGEPASKCESFRQWLERIDGQVDVAVMKFCYIDFDQDSHVEGILDHYASSIGALEARYPKITFIHVTAPLKDSRAGAKRLLMDILGRPDTARLANLKRSRYNDLLRERFRGKPIFDLAAIESTDSHGRRNSFTADGQTGYSLVSDYTCDGGHLNEAGRNIAAREFIRKLAEVASASHAIRITAQRLREQPEKTSK